MQDSIQSQFNDQVDEYYNANVTTGTSIESDISETIDVPKNTVNKVIVAVPEIILGVISEYRDLRTSVQIWDPENNIGSTQANNFLLAHSLSAAGDTAFLLADIGRAARLSRILGKNLEVLLAGKQWSRRNWNIAQFKERNLVFNEEWRKQIYETVGANVTVWELDNIQGESGKELREYSNDILSLATAIAGTDKTGKRLSKEDRKDILDNIEISTSTNGDLLNILNIGLVEDRLEPEIEAIRHIISRLRYISYNTIMYFLMQMYAQSTYSSCTKTGIKREIDFDQPFYMMSTKYSRRESVNNGFYFENYIMKDLQGDSVSVHPYCFPSGTAYQENDFQECLDLVPHLDDLNNKEKIKSSLERLEYPHNARFIGDLLSFIHFFSQPSLRRLQDYVEESLGSISEEWASSWHKYARKDSLFIERTRRWTYMWSSRWYDQAPKLPYYYYPFFVLAGEDSSNDITIDAFANILSRLDDELESQQWHTP